MKLRSFIALSALAAVLPTVRRGGGAIPGTAARTPASPSGYTLTDLGRFGRESAATGLNGRGQAVGRCDGKAVLWAAGKMTDLGGIPTSMGNDCPSEARAINDRGQVVGASGSGGPIFMSGLEDQIPFLYDHGRAGPLPSHEDMDMAEAHGINDLGEIVGFEGYRGFILSHGKFVSWGTLSKRPRGNGSTANAVNNKGWAAGASTVNCPALKPDEDLPVHAVLRRNGRLRDLGTLPGAPDSAAYGINERGEVVGAAGRKAGWRWAILYDPERAFLWRAGRMTALRSLPGAALTRANGINDRGEIAGVSGGRAVLWRKSRVFDLNRALPEGSGWVLTDAAAINDRGQIAGTGKKAGSPSARAFLLTPK